MKPIDGTYVNNALTWGVAGLDLTGENTRKLIPINKLEEGLALGKIKPEYKQEINNIGPANFITTAG